MRFFCIFIVAMPVTTFGQSADKEQPVVISVTDEPFALTPQAATRAVQQLAARDRRLQTPVFPHAFTGFKVVSRRVDQEYQEEQMTRNGQPVANASERVIVRRYFTGENNEAERRRFAESIQKEVASHPTMPGQFETLDENDDRTIYQITLPAKDGFPGKTEITALISTPQDICYVSWSCDVNPIIEEGREYWTNAMRRLTFQAIASDTDKSRTQR